MFVRMEGLPTTRERERSPGRGSASQPGGSPDGPDRRRRRPTVQVEGQATQEEFSSPMSPEFHLTGVQGLYQLNSHSKLCRLVSVVMMVEGLVPHLVCGFCDFCC